ncbi:MAG: hypothetical protein QXD88_00710 [Candidatus Anstonellales archaeon]
MQDDLLIFEEFRDALFKSFYDDNVKISNIPLFIVWVKKELNRNAYNLGIPSEDFLEAVIKILSWNNYNIEQFYEELDNRKWKRIVFMKLDPTNQMNILNRDPEAIDFLKDATPQVIARFKEILIDIAKNPKHPNQYTSIFILSKIISDPEVKNLYKELLYDWDENLRRSILLVIKETRDPELIEYIKILKSEENDDTNLKIIQDILNNG